MFQTLIYPSSGACDCAVELPHQSFCSPFIVCWRFGVGPCCRLSVEQNDGCGNSTAQSQAPDDGYINVQNMLST